MNEGFSEAGERRRIARWVADEVLPHEAKVRGWLRRARVSAEDIDEIIQEAYSRLSMLERVDHIDSGYSYFFSITRNLLTRRLKRQRIVPFEAIAEIDAFVDDRPSPERQVAGKIAYAKILDMIELLPERCRQVMRLRKIEGWTQRAIAEHLGVTEKAIEKHVWTGVRMIRDAWSRGEQDAENRLDYSERRGGEQ